MTSYKDFLRVKKQEGTLSKGVAEKDIRTRFGVLVCGKSRDTTRENINNQRHEVWIGQEPCDISFSNQEPIERQNLGIRLIK